MNTMPDTDPVDVANGYRVLLGRSVENPEVCEQQSGVPMLSLIHGLWNSEEFAAVIENLRKGSGDRFCGAPLGRDARWIRDRFPLSDAGRDRLAYLESWPELYNLLLNDPVFLETVDAMALDWRPQELRDLLVNWSRAFPLSMSTDPDPSVAAGDTDLDTLPAAPLDFDESVYGRYADVQASGLASADHYRQVGRGEGRVYNKRTLQQRADGLRNVIDSELYTAQRPAVKPVDVIEDWVFFGSINDLRPVKDFSTRYYRARYPDVVASGIDALEHFVLHGRQEGRTGYFDVGAFMRPGGRRQNLLQPTIILTCHEASRTGAPILGLALLGELNRTHNVIILMPRGGELLDDFEQACMSYGIGHLSPLDGVILLNVLRERFDVEAVVMNSIEASFMAEAALRTDMPCVGLIHEFASYTKPATRMIQMVERMDVVVAPAKLIADQIHSEARLCRSGSALNVVVRPQGYIKPKPLEAPPREMTVANLRAALGISSDAPVPAIVLGGGTVQMRKGVDLFIQTAAEVRRIANRPVKFLWVGHGYDPHGDVHYSMYIDYMIRALDLQNEIFIAPPMKSFNAVIEMADVFFVSSRQDPFPNVALDAFAADKPVVCFDRGTGIVEAIERHGFVGGVAGFCDVAHAARLIVECIDTGPLSGQNRALIEQDFSLPDYADDIRGFIDRAKAITAERRDLVAHLVAQDCFDAEFYENRPLDNDDERRHAARLYAARGQKGLIQRNPRPGFNEGSARATVGRPTPALLAMVEGGDGCPTTHPTVELDHMAVPRAIADLRVAVHVHFHYAQLATEFVSLCRAARMEADIFVSTTSSRGRVECEHSFLAFQGGAVKVLEVENRGRDILPMFADLREVLNPERYDLVGHFHGKRTAGFPEMGDNWRRFLLTTLIGDAANLKKVLGLFVERPQLGMVFAEDSHAVDWNDNLPFAVDLAARLSPQPEIPAYPIFPIGTMFWARPAALSSIIGNEALFDLTPLEPLRDDGTILHALERLLPSIVTSNGFDWLTVHRQGLGW